MYYAMYRDEQRVAVLIISHYYKYGNAASSLSFLHVSIFSASTARNAKFAGDFRSRRRPLARRRRRVNMLFKFRLHIRFQTMSVPLTKGYYVRRRGRRVSCENSARSCENANWNDEGC